MANIIIRRDIEQRTDAWMEVKRGKTSGSGIKPILSAKSKGPWKTYAYKILAERENREPATYEEGFLSKSVQWGKDTEPFAIDKFMEQTGLIVEEVGWVESVDPKLAGKSGCSPDGIIDIYEWIEVKCLDTKKHIEYVILNKLPLEYEPQVINYFVVNPDLKKVHFILYDPRVKTAKKRLHVIEILRENVKDKIDKLYDGLVEFHDMVGELHREFIDEDEEI